LNTNTSLKDASIDPQYGRTDFILEHALDGSSQPLIAASDKTSPGGSRFLYDVVYKVTATISNTGHLAGDEVPQMCVDLGGDNPPHQLRDFAQLRIDPGQITTYSGTFTRRDLSNWDTVSQNLGHQL
jgi:hypothetical protein